MPLHTAPRRTSGTTVLAAALVTAVVLVAAAVLTVLGPGPVDLVPLPSLGLEGDDGDLGGTSLSVDDDSPALTRLDPALLDAVRAAADDAADDGVEVRITSGWRSAAFQQQLLDEAVERYGSREEALRWVATPERSHHVTGDAVDIGPTDAAYWMSEHGSDHGLCQTYANEVWHYELVTTPGGTCPEMRADGSA